MAYVTEGGLIVTDRRHERAASEHPQIDPRDHVDNGNVYPSPGGTVGPGSQPGPVHAFHADAWAGWPSGWSTPYMEQGVTGEMFNARTATAVTCVDLNSRQIASFPIYGLKGVEPVRLPSWRSSPEPELYGSWSDFMHGVCNALMMRGEAFQFVTGRFADESIARFVNLNPDAVGIEFIDGRIEYLIDGDPIDRRDICHLKYQSWPGRLRGISPLDWSARSLATSSSLETYAMQLATRGGIPWGVLKALRNLDSGQAKDAQDRWVEAAARRDGAPAVLGAGFDLQPVSFSPEQMALLGLREFDERRVASAFGVPGYLVNVSMAQGLTYTNASQLFQHHWTSTLRPMAQMISESWSNWLLPRGTVIEFNPDRYVQPPLSERSLAYNYLFNMVDPLTGHRAIEIEEIRAAERMPPAGWVDEVTHEQGLDQAQRVVGGRTA